MILVKSPFRICFFGGSTDYESFYKENGSFLIGTTIDKYVYLSMRDRPVILPKESLLVYSKMERVSKTKDIKQPLIRNILQYYGIDSQIELTSFSDIPSRTGLGGSSAYCVGLCHLISLLKNLKRTKKQIAKDAIHIERKLMKDPGGIQDQIWASYGGLNTININRQGDFFVKPLAVTSEFSNYLNNSLVLIYTEAQRQKDDIAKSHEKADKKAILQIAKEAHNSFLSENVKKIGQLMMESWIQKKNISSLISNNKIDSIIEDLMRKGAHGAKLLGSGGCGFILAVCDRKSKNKIKEAYSKNILEFKLEKNGAEAIYKNLN